MVQVLLISVNELLTIILPCFHLLKNHCEEKKLFFYCILLLAINILNPVGCSNLKLLYDYLAFFFKTSLSHF